MRVIKTFSAEETKKAAMEFSAGLKKGDVVALVGDLGAGKTAFVQGVAEYFGYSGDVVSPTYTLVNEYNGDVNLYHFDVYRIENISTSDTEWIDEYLFGDGICLIEWADNIAEILPKGTLRVEIKKTDDENSDLREIKIC